MKWTLESKKNWDQTNRFSAKIMVALGLIYIIFLIVAFGLAWILQIVASNFANKGNEMAFRGMMAGCMYMPFSRVLVQEFH